MWLTSWLTCLNMVTSTDRLMPIIRPYHRCMKKTDGCNVGHSMITRLLKRVFHQRLLQSRYSQTWDVGVVMSFICSRGDNKSLSLQEPTYKLAMSMALTRPYRSADLAKLDLNHRTYSVEGVTFLPTASSMESRQQKHGMEFHFPSYPQDELLCPVTALREYEFRTKSLSGSYTSLFISASKLKNQYARRPSHDGRNCFLEAGVDTEISKAHSVGSASASVASAHL